MQGADFSGVKPVFLVLGCDTDVGKTLVSAGLARAFAAMDSRVCYVKPWQTGLPSDSDAEFVETIAGCEVHTLQAYSSRVSPHTAASHEGLQASDDATMARVISIALSFAGSLLVEGAGGVASPTAEGRLQCDVLRAVRAPVVLVGSGALGGISVTLCAVETLRARGFDVDAIVLRQGTHGNADFLRAHFAAEEASLEKSGAALSLAPAVFTFSDFPSREEPAIAWFELNAVLFEKLTSHLMSRHEKRAHEESRAKREGGNTVWWPFTQHETKDGAHFVSSARGDEIHFGSEGALFDASASWWTQNLGHARSELARTASHAAARYGHVIFPGNVHRPALALAEALVSGVGRGYSARAFFSDNGSTAVEVALKMAFRLRLARLGRQSGSGIPKLRVLGLRDSYHGDTIGAMDAASPNAFNAKEPWYVGRGTWLSFPTVRMNGDGTWSVVPSADCTTADRTTADRTTTVDRISGSVSFASRAEMFSRDRMLSPLAAEYARVVQPHLDDALAAEMPYGALLIEPLVHASGGMHFVDPLFQTVLAREARSRGIPVVFDEVFAGLWRLGFERAADALHVLPDIACYSKALTGGLVPLGVTLASAETFDAFRGQSTLDALLHGHSYTAYPVGCAVALQSLALAENTPWVKGARAHVESGAGGRGSWAGFSVFPEEGVRALAALPQVARAWSLGTVFAAELRSAETGYGSGVGAAFVKRLRARGIAARPLGNVLYAVTTLETSAARAAELVETYGDVFSGR